MIITSGANLQFFFTALHSTWGMAYGAAPTMYDKICSTYPVGTEQWVSGWIGMYDKVREWKGSRVVGQPAPQTYLVQIQNFEQTKSIDKFKLQDDSVGAPGIYAQHVTNMAIQAKKWPDYQVRDLLQALGSQGSTQRQLGIDGLSHFNTVHPVDFYDSTKGTYCNDFRGGFSVGGITVGGTLDNQAYSTLWNEFASRKSESGEALGLIPDTTLIPPQLSYTAKTILGAEFFAPATLGNFSSQVGAADNMLKGSTDLLMWPDLAGVVDDWYMLMLKGPVKPFSWLLRQAPDFTYRINEQDPSVFDTHTYLYGSVSRGAPAWAFPWLSAVSGPSD